MIRPACSPGFLFLLACGLASSAPVSTATGAPTASVQEATPSSQEYGCLICHADKRRAYRLGIHSERGVR